MGFLLQIRFEKYGLKSLSLTILFSCLITTALIVGSEDSKIHEEEEFKFLDSSEIVPSHTNIAFKKILVTLADGSTTEALVHQFIEKDFFYLTLVIKKQENAGDSFSWRWDPIWQRYNPENATEQSVWIFLKDQNGFYDLWIWRPSRNAYCGFADDYYCMKLSDSYQEEKDTDDSSPFFKTPIIYVKDEGKLGWTSRYFAKFAGEKIPRYYQRSPSGSAGDVVLIGALKKSFWILKYKRKLNTNNFDDIQFHYGQNLIIGIHVGTPSKNPPELIPFQIQLKNNKKSD